MDVLENKDFQAELEKNQAARAYNIIKQTKQFTIVRFELDTATVFNQMGTSRNQVAFPFRGFWVYDTNDDNFSAQIKIGKLDQGDALTLKPNMTISWDYPVAGAILQWETAQTGVWVDIVFSHEAKLEPGNTNLSISGEVSLEYGDNGDTDRVAMATTTTTIFAASSTQKMRVIQNKLAESIWISWGTNYSSRLTDADYANRCIEIGAGLSFTLPAKYTGAIYGRIATASATKYITAGYMEN